MSQNIKLIKSNSSNPSLGRLKQQSKIYVIETNIQEIHSTLDEVLISGKEKKRDGKLVIFFNSGGIVGAELEEIEKN